MAELLCCSATGCRLAGAGPLRRALGQARTGQDAGAAVSGEPVSGHPVAIKPVGCLRLCSAGPLVAVQRDDGSRALYGGVPPALAPALLAAARGVADEALHRHRLDLEHPFFALQQCVVLETCGQVDPTSLDDALAHGAYRQLQRCRDQLSPARLRREIAASGLRGRGGAGYPTGLKWEAVALQPPGPRHVVCNGDEGDPGAFMDRAVMEGDPHRLLEGLAIAAHAVGAARGTVYVRAEYPLAIRRLRRALRQASARGLLGLAVELRVGAGAYVCGEETALLASIAGRRGNPRPRPPYPAQHGLNGMPTLINNVETLAALPAILRRGASWYAAIGPAESPGTKVFSLSGAVQRTGLVEVPIGTPLRTVVLTMAGGVPGADGPDGGIKAVQTGGPSGGCIPATALDTPLADAQLRALGARLGSGGMVVLGAATAMPALARYFVRFCAAESCGKCVPCRAGTVEMVALLDRFCEGRATAADRAWLEQLCALVQSTSLCGLGQSAPNPVLSTLRHFAHEYRVT